MMKIIDNLEGCRQARRVKRPHWRSYSLFVLFPSMTHPPSATHSYPEYFCIIASILLRRALRENPDS